MACVAVCGAQYETCVSRVPLFQHLDEEQQRQVAELIEHRNYRAGAVIFHVDEAIQDLMILRRGQVKLLRYTADGEERLVDLLMAGDFYGGEQFLEESPAEETGVALGDCEFCYLNKGALASLILREPEIGLKLIQYYSSLASRYRSRQEILMTKDALQRLVLFLLSRQRQTSSLCLDLSQEEIAQAVNLTQETVNRKLAELKRGGLIRIQGQRKLEICDLEKLRSLRPN